MNLIDMRKQRMSNSTAISTLDYIYIHTAATLSCLPQAEYTEHLSSL